MSKASDIHKVFLLRKSLNSLRKVGEFSFFTRQAVIAERCNNECAEKHHQASLQRKVLTAWLRSALVGAGQREVRVIAMLASAAENHDKWGGNMWMIFWGLVWHLIPQTTAEEGACVSEGQRPGFQSNTAFNFWVPIPNVKLAHRLQEGTPDPKYEFLNGFK